MRRLSWLLGASLLLAGCPIAADNYGVDAGDAGSVADAGSTTTTDAGPPSGSVSCIISAEDVEGDMTGNVPLAWTTADLSGSAATTSDGETYNVLIAGSNTSSGTIELEVDGLTVGGSAGCFLSSSVSVAYESSSTLVVQDSWTCTDGANCGPCVVVTSFDGQTLIGSFSVQFSPSSQGSTASLSNGTFNVTIPNSG